MKFIDALLFTYLFTASCAVGLCMATERLIIGYCPPLYTPLHILVLGSTLLVYNLPVIINSTNSQRFYSQRGIFFFIGGLLTVLSFFFLPIHIIIAATLLGMLALAYSLPILPFKNKKRLRDFGWLKIIDLAGVWTIATAILPILYYQKPVLDFLVEIAIRFVLIFILCIVFDLRDMQLDHLNNLKTLPNKIGIKNSYLLINAAIILFVVLSIIQFNAIHNLHQLLASLSTAMVMHFIAPYLHNKPYDRDRDRFYIILGDGTLLLYALLVLL